jgi:hypothetical protein
MPRVGFEPTISLFERMKTFRVLDRAATVIGCCGLTVLYFIFRKNLLYKYIFAYVKSIGHNFEVWNHCLT